MSARSRRKRNLVGVTRNEIYFTTSCSHPSTSQIILRPNLSENYYSNFSDQTKSGLRSPLLVPQLIFHYCRSTSWQYLTDALAHNSNKIMEHAGKDIISYAKLACKINYIYIQTHTPVCVMWGFQHTGKPGTGSFFFTATCWVRLMPLITQIIKFPRPVLKGTRSPHELRQMDNIIHSSIINLATITVFTLLFLERQWR